MKVIICLPTARCVFLVSFIWTLATIFFLFYGIQIGKTGRPVRGEHGVGQDTHELLRIPARQDTHHQQDTTDQAKASIQKPQDAPIKQTEPPRHPASDAGLQKHIDPVHEQGHQGINETHIKPLPVPTQPTRGKTKQERYCAKFSSYFPGREPYKTTHEDINLTSSINEEDELKYATWLIEQTRRKKRVKDICRPLRAGETGEGWWEIGIFYKQHEFAEAYRHILVDDKHKVLYCSIPKAACTSWKSMLLTLTGHFNPSHPEAFRQCVHDDDFMSKHGLRMLSDPMFTKNNEVNRRGQNAVQYRLREYTKFMVVRDPIRRLLSAFQSNFRNKDNPSNESLTTGENVTLSEEFLRFLTGGIPRSPLTQPFNTLCQPCLIDYDYIATVETLDEDSEFILDRVFHTDFRLQSLQATERIDTRLLDYIPANFLKDGSRYYDYDLDYKLFGYK